MVLVTTTGVNVNLCIFSGMGWVNIFETIEYRGDYGVTVAMLFILSYRAKSKPADVETAES